MGRLENEAHTKKQARTKESKMDSEKTAIDETTVLLRH